MKTLIFKFFIAAALQFLFAASAFGQKYENGTRLLKGAEVMSATPLQLDYVLETLADTAKITVNLHEGKTHLVLNDGSGKWREWWYYRGHWQPKSQGASPAGLEGSIQTKAGNAFAGSQLGINNSFINSLSSSDVGFTGGGTNLLITPQGDAEHRKNAGLWNFRSSLDDTTFHVYRRIRFNPKYASQLSSIQTDMFGNLNLLSKFEQTLSQISISSVYSGIELYSKTHLGTSHFFINNGVGMTLKDRFQDRERQSDVSFSPFSTVFAWQDSDRSREFSLDEATMKFITKQGASTTSMFYANSGSLDYHTEKTYFTVADNVLIYRPYDNDKNRGYFAYSLNEKSLRLKNAIYFETDDATDLPGIALTGDRDMRFTRAAVPSKSITLTEICQKGQIITQDAEPDIPDNSFAFWVQGNTFYLILRANGVQKKVQLQ
jgi:hypothetical protein